MSRYKKKLTDENSNLGNCDRCAGTGSIKVPHGLCQGHGCNDDNAGKGYVWQTCPKCHGTGNK